MRIAGAILVAALLTTGCARTYYVRSMDSREFSALEDRAASSPGEIVLFDGTVHRTKSIKVGGSETAWVDAETDATKTTPTEMIYKIVFGSRAQAVATSALGGLIGVGAMGAGLGYALGSKDDEKEITRSFGMKLGFAVFGIIGALAGGAEGAHQGAPYTYVLFPGGVPDESGSREDVDSR